MKKVLILSSFLFLFMLLFLYLYIVQNPADRKTEKKVSLIEMELKKTGYSPKWITISKKRDAWYNNILKNSSRNSYHLAGRAIDVWVIDIDGDSDFDKEDKQLIIEATEAVEKEHPQLVGALGFYTRKGYPSNRMVHMDTRGYKKIYGL